MPKINNVSVSLNVDPDARAQVAEPDADTPFRILLIGDFSGRSANEEASPGLSPYAIDRDNIDLVMARLRPSVRAAGNNGFVLQFQELDDFHPDSIYRHEIFKRLCAAGASPAGPARPRISVSAPARSEADVRAMINSGSLLDSVLDATESEPARPLDALREFVERVVAPHTEPREDPRVAARAADAEAEAGRMMRAILHHPDFQALEASWRGLTWLVRGIETGPQLKIYALDMSKAVLSARLDDFRRVLTGASGGEPWGMVAADFTFSRTVGDIRLLSELAAIARAAGTVFVAEADPNDADSPEAETRWETLRNSPAAHSIGLALPRFLLRLPYGAATDPIESFALEEMPGLPDHRNYLWGNPAFACAYLIGQSFHDEGWDLRPGTHAEITSLPQHVYKVEGEPQLKPCAEVLMSDKDAEWIMDQGYMPLASIKDQDAARWVRFQSIANPPAPLAGAWH